MASTAMVMCVMLAAAVMGPGSAGSAGAVPGGPATRRHPRTASFSHLYCGVGNWNRGEQALSVNLTQADCTSETLPLVATYLAGQGITAANLQCNDETWGRSPSIIETGQYSDCSTVVAALNARVGGSAFICEAYGDIFVKASKCAAKVAALNAGIAPPPPSPPGPPGPPGPPPACAGQDRAFCSTTDPSTWCCNLEVFDCVCADEGTYAQISLYCNTSKNRGINCANCPTSPQCKTGSAAAALL